MIYVLLTYIAVILTIDILRKEKHEEKKVEKKEKQPRTVHSKSSFSTPLQTYKEFDKFKDKKSNLYTPIKKPSGRGEKIIKREEK